MLQFFALSLLFFLHLAANAAESVSAIGAAPVPKTAVAQISALKALASVREPEPASVKETRSQRLARIKDERANSELAEKLAESLAGIRKNKTNSANNAEYAAAAAAASVRSKFIVTASYRPAVEPNEKPRQVSPTITNPVPLTPSALVRKTFNSAQASLLRKPTSISKSSPFASDIRCDSGLRQSPIDVRDGIRLDLDALNFDYKATRFKVLDNGMTLVVTPESGNFLNVSGRSYELQEFRFYRPSDISIDGKHAEMVVHLQHRDSEGHIAIVALMLDVGEANPVIQQVWNNIPLEKNDPVQAVSSMELLKILPDKLTYYTFMGSLTEPPCTEGVVWIVLKQHIQIAPEQAAIFARLYPMNARPLQKSGDRLIKESN